MSRILPLALFTAIALRGQWSLQNSQTTADLRGIHSTGAGVAWASGTRGTVLHTTDGGLTWLTCPTPPGAENLDFRAIQAFDKQRAIVMSSGKGDLSRIYKTTDGCLTWRLLFTNPDKDGFWDAMQFSNPDKGMLAGDPVDGRFAFFVTADAGETWQKPATSITANKHQSLFAASNSALMIDSRNQRFYLLTGGGTTALITPDSNVPATDMASGETAGGFSLASRQDKARLVVVAVGGDYKQPDQSAGTAATWIADTKGSLRYKAPVTNPHGYRSAVAWNAANKLWIATGPGGTDISTDDGRNWRALKADASGANRNWNALSLPFAVGPRGRIGILHLNSSNGTF